MHIGASLMVLCDELVQVSQISQAPAELPFKKHFKLTYNGAAGTADAQPEDVGASVMALHVVLDYICPSSHAIATTVHSSLYGTDWQFKRKMLWAN